MKVKYYYPVTADDIINIYDIDDIDNKIGVEIESVPSMFLLDDSGMFVRYLKIHGELILS